MKMTHPTGFDGVIAEFDLPELDVADSKVYNRHYKIVRTTLSGKVGTMQLIEVGIWNKGKYDPKAERVLISYTTDNITDVALDPSLRVMWFGKMGFSEEVSDSRLRELIEHEKELETLKRAWKVLTTAEK